MRILYCANDPVPFPKGAGVRIEATVRALIKAGAQLTLATPDLPKPQGFASVLEGIDHHLIGVGPGEEAFIDRALRFRRGVEELLTSRSWDVFWFRSPWEGWAARRVGFAGKLVYEAHGFPSMELPHHYPQLFEHPEFLGRLAYEEQALLQAARLIFTVSRTGLRFLATRGVPAERVMVLPNSAPEEAFLQGFKPAAEEAFEAREALDAGEALEAGDKLPPFRILYTGTLAPWQGLEVLVEALLHLKNRLPVRLQLVGTRKGRWTRPLRALSQQMRVRSLIEFTGPFTTQELRQRMIQFDLGVAPLPKDSRNTVQGCCPIKLIEFMAAGLPILSTRLPVVEELLTHQESAWLVRPDSPWALAQGILRLASDPELRQRLAARAQSVARERYHRNQFENRLAEALQSLRGN